MLVTVCTIAQLPQALTLGSSFQQHHPDQPVVLGLADDPAHLPTGWQSPYPLLTLADAGFTAESIAALSARYTPTAFRAATKPAFIRAAYDRYYQTGLSWPGLLYADPSGYVLGPLTNFFSELTSHSLLLNPHWLLPPTGPANADPDEKYLQNVGLYSSGFIGFGRQPDTLRMLGWWHERVQHHAHLDFCAGQCLDQLWLMHTPQFFENVGILHDPALQVALWNLPERTPQQTPQGWQVAHNGQTKPLLTIDVLGLRQINEGLFQHQNRLRLHSRPDAQHLLSTYQTALKLYDVPALAQTPPAYGQQPELTVLRGWRRNAAQALSRLSHWLDNVPVPPLHR
jgi:hypothetical protein